MIQHPQSFVAALMAGLLSLADAGTASAGWMGFRNETPEPIVIQETVVVNGQLRPGRPQRLASGEAVRDTQCAGGQRHFSVFDPKRPNQPVYTGTLPCPGPAENFLYLIKSERGGIALEPVKSPAVPPKK